MLTGIIPATRMVLDRAGLRVSDIDAFEVNEAFASVVLAWQIETGADLAKVNINGGAIALGHPLGVGGTRLLATLLSVLRADRRPIRPADDVRSRRTRQRDDHRAPGMNSDAERGLLRGSNRAAYQNLVISSVVPTESRDVLRFPCMSRAAPVVFAVRG